jgi:hypothetical protein
MILILPPSCLPAAPAQGDWRGKLLFSLFLTKTLGASVKERLVFICLFFKDNSGKEFTTARVYDFSSGLSTVVFDEPCLLTNERDWHYSALAANIAIGLAIVFGGAGACEWLVRRRAL